MEPSPPRSPRPPLPGPPLPPFDVNYNPRTQVHCWPGHRRASLCSRWQRTPATKEEREQPAVEPLIQGMTDLTISDQPATTYHRADPPSPTPDMANPNPNMSGSSSLPRISPLGNRVIHRVIQLPTSTRTQPTVGHPGAVTDVHPSDSTVWRVWFRH
jgi:hypothetical protein